MIEQGAVVIISCGNPREKLWGVLLRLDAVGAVIRGLDINSVEDWLRQQINGDEPLIGPSTVFIPSRRIERIYLDETSGGAQSFRDRYRQACGGDVRDILGTEA